MDGLRNKKTLVSVLCRNQSDFFLQEKLLIFCHGTNNQQSSDHQQNTNRQTDDGGHDCAGKCLYDTGNQVSDSRYDGNGNGIRKLCGYVVYVVTLGAGRSHDRCVGNW